MRGENETTQEKIKLSKNKTVNCICLFIYLICKTNTTAENAEEY